MCHRSCYVNLLADWQFDIQKSIQCTQEYYFFNTKWKQREKKTFTQQNKHMNNKKRFTWNYSAPKDFRDRERVKSGSWMKTALFFIGGMWFESPEILFQYIYTYIVFVLFFCWAEIIIFKTKTKISRDEFINILCVQIPTWNGQYAQNT